MRLFLWLLTPVVQALTVVPPPNMNNIPSYSSTVVSSASSSLSPSIPTTTSDLLSNGISSWLLAAEPTKDDIQLLRRAMAEFYGVDRNLEESLKLLTETIQAWQKQPADELAGLYRVRGDCYTLLNDGSKAIADYTQSIDLWKISQVQDSSELASSLLGRARALKAAHITGTTAVADYRQGLILSSREEWDTEQELLQDGVTRNPYAAWEYATVLRSNGQYAQASRAHLLASAAFDEIGDKTHAVVSLIDAGIDLAGDNNNNNKEAKELLEKAVRKQISAPQQAQGYMALAALQWDAGERMEAENSYQTACQRLDEGVIRPKILNDHLLFSIDDTKYPTSGGQYFNAAALEELDWPTNLQNKLKQFKSFK